MNTQLVCTFVNRDDLDLVIDYISKSYTIPDNIIFVFENAHAPHKMYCTYNIDKNNLISEAKNTILIHRKKESNTLYIVNALNCIIRDMNNGVLDKSIQINWENYSNSMLLTNNGELYRINLNFVDKISI